VRPLHLDLPGVQPHADGEPAGLAQALRRQRQLGREGGGHRRAWGGEGGVDRVSHRLEDHAPVRRHRAVEHGLVPEQSHPVRPRMGLLQSDAAVHVCEQEGHRASWQLRVIRRGDRARPTRPETVRRSRRGALAAPHGGCTGHRGARQEGRQDDEQLQGPGPSAGHRGRPVQSAGDHQHDERAQGGEQDAAASPRVRLHTGRAG
jgi:hypothetical protein